MANKKECKTCKCPILPTVTKEQCPGLSDGVISPVSDCKKWTPMPKRITVTEAKQYSVFVNTERSRPTIIAMCKKHKMAKQINGWGYSIDAEKFRDVLEGE